ILMCCSACSPCAAVMFFEVAPAPNNTGTARPFDLGTPHLSRISSFRSELIPLKFLSPSSFVVTRKTSQGGSDLRSSSPLPALGQGAPVHLRLASLAFRAAPTEFGFGSSSWYHSRYEYGVRGRVPATDRGRAAVQVFFPQQGQASSFK